MPTYVYECEKCGDFEVRQAITAPALTECPTCAGAVRRVLAGGTSFQIEGEGGAGGGCTRSTPCCGRATRCDKPPCGR
ncbi:MAG: zinc ribbon domain-containing protein [Myxococcota bacterium]|nr:zinc ribbon domain-containing protein [Myxococcota bacterium]